MLGQADAGRFILYLAEELLAETQRILPDTERIRSHYHYSDDNAYRFIEELQNNAHLIGSLPPLTGIARDPNDDMIIACASAAFADHMVTCDKDLLSLRTYDSITMVTPEVFMETLRSEERG
ncbi:MAG: hypothetical protein ETSY2_52340 [Candidatus Entotheonella gemina]|uniref:PIN domain-containing protein n=1 Tax=Candidatus Entotheonella gemina TaxID=1429439 RepID=W4L5E4_9BACT|nr:PIN domain-containing protein [Candidatus Entotheonella palauensis]ETW92900.1 MAG: hypothetical protein ETSY2_52340 [Candidatus Entotheonella gemina]